MVLVKLATQIKQSKGEGSQLERAERFGVSKYIVSDIDRGRTWVFIPDKNGVITDTINMREKDKKRRILNKTIEFTMEDWTEALKRLREKSKDSETIHPNVLTPCHLYQGRLYKNGYGHIKFKGIDYLAHILACEAKQSKKRENSKQVVRHLCDTAQCCNPEHLFFGTSQQNAIDAIPHNRSRKLTVDQVKEIKLLLREGQMTNKEIASHYLISDSIISNIKTGRKWSHITI